MKVSTLYSPPYVTEMVETDKPERFLLAGMFIDVFTSLQVLRRPAFTDVR